MPSDGGEEIQIYAGFVRAAQHSELDCVRRFLIADAYARFRRARGDAVSFALGVESLGEAVEGEAVRGHVHPDELVLQAQHEVQHRFEQLGISCDWSRTVVSSSPGYAHELQERFLELLAQDLVYRDEPANGSGPGGSRWLLRSGRYAEACERGLEQLGSWTHDAIESQRSALGRIEGVEVEAALLGFGALTLFTPHAEAIADAAFVALPRDHPTVATLAPGEGAEGLLPGVQAAVPEVDSLLPVVVTAAADARFGSVASLGIPAADERDRAIAAGLQAAESLSFKAVRSHSKPRAAVRYLLPDLPISRPGAWGVPVPVAHCRSCLVVPLPAEQLSGSPVEWRGQEAPATGGDEPRSLPCPACGGPAELDTEMIAADFAGMWMWSSGGDSAAAGDSAPPRYLVWGADDSSGLLRQRLAGALGTTSPEGAEPFDAATLVGSLEASGGDVSGVGGVEDLDALIARAGADVARFAILHTAAPRTSTCLPEHSIRHAERFLSELVDFAEPRLREQGQSTAATIDRSSGLRRRLAAWCAIASHKIDANMERLEVHRATFEMIRFLRRIQDFEARCVAGEGLAREDQEAVAVALSQLIEKISPCVPATAAGLSAVRTTPALA